MLKQYAPVIDELQKARYVHLNECWVKFTSHIVEGVLPHIDGDSEEDSDESDDWRFYWDHS